MIGGITGRLDEGFTLGRATASRQMLEARG
jgi:hypothetical protein